MPGVRTIKSPTTAMLLPVMGSIQPSRTTRWGQDHLAERLVRLGAAVGVGRLGEREDAVDHRRDLAGEGEPHHRGEVAPVPHRRAEDAAVALVQLSYVELRSVAGGGAADDQPTAAG